MNELGKMYRMYLIDVAVSSDSNSLQIYFFFSAATLKLESLNSPGLREEKRISDRNMYISLFCYYIYYQLCSQSTNNITIHKLQKRNENL